MEDKQKQNQVLLKSIIIEYHKAYQEILDGTITEISFGSNGEKKVFAVKKTENWGLTTGKTRKNGRKGDITTIVRLKRLANLGLFSEDNFNNYKGDLHGIVKGNHVDAKYIMMFLFNRVVQLHHNYHVSEDSRDFGFEEYDAGTEGNRMRVEINRYERNKSIRDKILNKKHGDYSCEVCGFNFESVYGELGKGFIHVHHRKPLYLIGENYHPDIEKDFALVCPNCHAMLHRNRKDILTVEELRKKFLIKKEKTPVFGKRKPCQNPVNLVNPVCF